LQQPQYAVAFRSTYLFFANSLFLILALTFGWTEKIRNVIFDIYLCGSRVSKREMFFVNLLSSSFFRFSGFLLLIQLHLASGT